MTDYPDYAQLRIICIMSNSRSGKKTKKQSKTRARARTAERAKKKESAPSPGLLAASVIASLNRRRDLGRVKRPLLMVLVTVALVIGGFALGATLPGDQPTGTSDYATRSSVTLAYDALNKKVGNLEDAQSYDETKVVSDATIRSFLTPIQLEIENSQFDAAQNLMQLLSLKVSQWTNQLPVAQSNPAMLLPLAASIVPTPSVPPVNSTYIPILVYHYPPPDFEQQLQILQQRGYTSVNLRQVSQALRYKAPLPAKPVVITFDDGFTNQMTAYELLKKYQMKATFYIINGGPESNWCIGASRRYGDPLQPLTGCGDSYLTWDQIRFLDASGLITIGGHTLNHRDLASLSAADQTHEIVDSKLGIEAELGHPIYDFAYPYGSFNATTVGIVVAAGYADAVSTLPGTYQSLSNIYALRRIRDTYSLP